MLSVSLDGASRRRALKPECSSLMARTCAIDRSRNGRRSRQTYPGCDGIRLVEHTEEHGARVFEHARKLGYEGIVSKRRGSWYRSGRCRPPAILTVLCAPGADHARHPREKCHCRVMKLET